MAQKTAAGLGLEKREGLRLSLLAEETLSLIRSLSGAFDGHVSFLPGSHDGAYIIKLDIKTNMTLEKRDEILALSRSGKNEATQGILGKIRRMFEICLYPMQASEDSEVVVLPGMEDVSPSDYVIPLWTLSNYRKEARNEQEKDELEKSILASLADDVRVSVFASHVVMEIERSVKA